MSKNRAIETRTNEMRNDYDMFYKSRLDVPLEVYEPEKYVYNLTRYTLKGNPDDRVEKLLRQGWELVPRLKDSPLDVDPLNRDPNTKRFYIVNGNIWMRIDKEVYDRRVNQKHKAHESKVAQIKIATNDASSFIKSSGLTSF